MLMDVTLKRDEDSDVEILEPHVLEDQFLNQQMRLITAISKCKVQIPKNWEDFEIFTKKVLKFQLSADLIRSVWMKLFAAEQLVNNSIISDIVEISDGEDFNQLQKDCRKEQLTSSAKVINRETVSGCRVKQFCEENVIETVEISDDEPEKTSLCSNHVEEKFSHAEIMGRNNDEEVSKLSLERSYNLSNGTKQRNSRKRRRSLPVSMDNEEAEALREKLLLDKIIELELSQIIKNLVKNNKLKGTVKMRKKKSFNRKVFNGLIVDENSCIEIP